MNVKKLIKNNFHFLLDDGFTAEIFTRNGDIEVIYRKKELTVEIFYYLSTTMEYVVSVILNFTGDRTNIFNSKLLHEEQVTELKSKIENHNSIQSQIEIYGEYVQKALNEQKNRVF